MSDFVVYLVSYYGDKHPPYYIGSTSKPKILSGYKGSPRSNKWSSIVMKEMKENSQLYEVEILEYCDTRKEALEVELRYQKENDVVKSDLFYNMSFASPNGFFGMDVSGVNNPRYGLEVSSKTRKLISEKNRGKVVVSTDGGNNWFIVSKEEYSKNKEMYITPKGEFNHRVSDATRERVRNGTHHFCNPEVQRKIAEKRLGMKMSEDQKMKLSDARKAMNLKPWQVAKNIGHADKWLLVYNLYTVYNEHVDLSRKDWRKNISNIMKSESEILTEYWCKKLASRFKSGWNPFEDLEFKEWFNENRKN